VCVCVCVCVFVCVCVCVCVCVYVCVWVGVVHVHTCVICMHMHVLALFALSCCIHHCVHSWNILQKSHFDARNFSLLHCTRNDLVSMPQPHQPQRNRILRVMWLRHVKAYLHLVTRLKIRGPVPPHSSVLSCYGA